MKHISILVFEDTVLSTLSGAYSLLHSTNELVRCKGEVPFQIELIGVRTQQVQLILPVQFMCTKTIKDRFHTDIIIIPSISSFAGDINQVLEKNRELISWLKSQWINGCEFLSMCTGSYFLAEAGILKGKEATSHWMMIQDMERRYPDICMKPDKIITDNDRVCTGGGAYSSLNAILYLIEKQCGKLVAIEISKEYSIDFGRTDQSIFSVFQGQRNHKDEDIQKAQDYIEQNFKKEINVEQIAAQTNMSKRNFIRRFKSATGNNPLEYIQRIRIESAKKQLEEGHKSIAEVTYAVGYNDLKNFRAVFRKITGLSPIEYMKRYNRYFS